jgi:hypothetical protein
MSSLRPLESRSQCRRLVIATDKPAVGVLELTLVNDLIRRLARNQSRLLRPNITECGGELRPGQDLPAGDLLVHANMVLEVLVYV